MGLYGVMEKITTNVPIVYMEVIILKWANPFRGPLKWVENQDHFRPEMATNEPHLRRIVISGEGHHTHGIQVRSAFTGRGQVGNEMCSSVRATLRAVTGAATKESRGSDIACPES